MTTLAKDVIDALFIPVFVALSRKWLSLNAPTGIRLSSRSGETLVLASCTLLGYERAD